ncbi:hypothetical protein ABH926_009991 [Catenulispora sp. GP43]
MHQPHEARNAPGARKLTCYRQAVFILAWMWDGGDIERLGAGFGLARTTSYVRHAEGSK